ncbi:phage tail protein [Stutzerimonas xanthomarina]|uniref:phage tail-collar fiber domain-containing protein n=1 Tax=Stutzerimonas xanthomarina TaxID=271420 RepID=UPI003AA8182A
MAFRTIHTLYGLTRLAQAEAAGSTINLPHMAVGDGNGNPVTPAESQTTLVRERYRAAVNRVYQDPTTPNKFSAELVIPATEGGFTLREVGLFDAAGALFVVGNLPDTYKPTSEEGAFSDTVVRVDFMVSNAATVEIIADPNVVLVTQQWISNNVTAATLIPGGSVGQLLGKASNADGDYEWQDPDAINVTVDTVAEKQLLAAGQTVVDLSVTTTYGLAVYIEGLRIDIGSGADEWQAHPTISTRLTLGKSYPAGTRITLVNNEPAGSAPAPLERDKNFADLQSKDTARTNLSVYSKAEVDQRVRNPGDIFYTAAATAPPFSLKANGAAVSRTAYAKLFARIGTRYGAGDGFTTFNLPDLRGEFLRGWDDGRGVDGGRELGSGQSGAIQSHAHSGSSADAGAHGHSGTANSGGAHNHAASSGAAGAHAHIVSSSVWTPTVGADTSGDGNEPRRLTNYGASDTWGNYWTSSAGNHAHSVSVGTGGAHTHNLSINSGGTHSHAITVAATGGAETRPRNLAMLGCIAF